MRIKKKVFFLFIAILIFTLALSGCYSLGDGTSNDEEYRENYSDIRLIDHASEVHEYTMEDFYNDQAVNDLISPMSEEERDEYSYILIRSEKALSLGEIAIYFDSTVNANVHVEVFILDADHIPTKVYTGKSGKYTSDECNEPDSADAVGEVYFTVPGTADKWQELYLTAWKDENGEAVKRRDIGAGEFIVFRILNNCYDFSLRDFENAEKTLDEVNKEYDENVGELEEIINDDLSTQAEKNAAQEQLNALNAKKDEAQKAYNEAAAKYEASKANALKRVPIRITAVLINAE